MLTLGIPKSTNIMPSLVKSIIEHDIKELFLKFYNLNRMFIIVDSVCSLLYTRRFKQNFAIHIYFDNFPTISDVIFCILKRGINIPRFISFNSQPLIKR